MFLSDLVMHTLPDKFKMAQLSVIRKLNRIKTSALCFFVIGDRAALSYLFLGVIIVFSD